MTTVKVTVPAIRERKQRGPKLAVATAYDATFARLLDEGGADILLVGDSLGMVVQGHADHAARHDGGDGLSRARGRARRRARPRRRRHAVHELPGLAEQALAQRGQAGEGGRRRGRQARGRRGASPTLVRRIVAAGIPVMGHVGLTPQSVHAIGGFKVQGNERGRRRSASSHDAARARAGGRVRDRARGDPARRSRDEITEAVDDPDHRHRRRPATATARCSSATTCSACTADFQPKFVKRYAELGDAIVTAMRAYVGEVQAGAFPEARHSFGMAQPKAVGEPTGAKPVVSGAAPQYGPADEK